MDLTDIQPNILDENTMKQIMCALVRQGVDRIDKIRGLSCMVLTKLLHKLERQYLLLFYEINLTPNIFIGKKILFLILLIETNLK